MKDLLNYKLFELSTFSMTITTILNIVGFTVIVFTVLYFIKKTIFKTHIFDIAKKFSIYSLIKYIILVIASVIFLQILGFNLTVLLTGSAALLVGVGLGLQNLFSDFISGIILLIDSSIKVNDIIDINGLVCQVQQINLRTTRVLTRDDKYIIVPNSDLTRNQVINWTHSDITSRFDVKVGVDYSSDVLLVMEILKRAVEPQTGILNEPAPFVRFENFGESSLDFSIIFWSNEVFRVENIKSEIRVRIFNLLKENNITIPFPQRVVHQSQGESQRERETPRESKTQRETK